MERGGTPEAFKVARTLSEVFRGLAVLGVVLAVFGLAPWKLSIAFLIASYLVLPDVWGRTKRLLPAAFGLLLALGGALAIADAFKSPEAAWQDLAQSWPRWLLLGVLGSALHSAWKAWRNEKNRPSAESTQATRPSALDSPRPAASSTAARPVEARATTHKLFGMRDEPLFCGECGNQWCPDELVEVRACAHCTAVVFDGSLGGRTCPECGGAETLVVTGRGCPGCLEEVE